MNATIVVPTCRQESITQFLEAWKEQLKNYRVIVVEDSPTRTFKLPLWVDHLAHKDIDQDLGDASWIISRRSSAIRNFGTLKALERHTDLIWHLDDDCLPNEGNELETHYNNLYNPTVDARWVTTDANGHSVRGVPYVNLTSPVEVVVSHGTWLKNPDYDAPHQLANRFDFEPSPGLVPLGKYFPMCGMNLAFKPEVAPAMYFAPSGPDQPYDRFDDIWMGIIAKKVFDHLNLRVSTGFPQIVHDRASDPFKNLIKEAPGIEANEGFWQRVDGYLFDREDLIGSMGNIAAQLVIDGYRDEKYFTDYGLALEKWADLTTRREAGDTYEQLRTSSRKHSTKIDHSPQDDKEQPAGGIATRGSAGRHRNEEVKKDH